MTETRLEKADALDDVATIDQAVREPDDRQITTRMLPGLAKALEVDRDDLLDDPDHAS